MTQDEFVDLTQEISDNSSVTHISEIQMVVSDDTLSYNSDSSSKSEKSGMYNLNFYQSINVKSLIKNFENLKNPKLESCSNSNFLNFYKILQNFLHFIHICSKF